MNFLNPLELNKNRVFLNRHAKSYSLHAILQAEIAARLLERLSFIFLKPTRILHLGAKTGDLSQKLTILYPESEIYSLDLAEKMLQEGVIKQKIRDPICANYLQLPFKPDSFDLVIAELVLPWVADYSQFFSACQRVLTEGGLLLFTTFGPDTLKELRCSFAKINSYSYVHEFIDMHHFGDFLLASYWLDPVVDMEIININYRSITQLLMDLKNTGSGNIHINRNRGLMTKNILYQMEKNYQQFANTNHSLPATYEIIYGHALKQATSIEVLETTEHLFPVKKLFKK